VFGPSKGFKEREAERQMETSQRTLMGSYNAAAPGAVRAAYAPAYADISAQFNPTLARARAFLANNPAAGRSGGVGNALNRRLLTGAYGDLTRAQAGTAGQAAMGGLDLLSSLIKQRQQARLDEEAKKRQGGGGLGGLVGGLAGSFLGPLGTAAGTSLGSKIF